MCPIILKASAKLPTLADSPMYLAVRLSKSGSKGRAAYALIEIPSHLPRFLALPKGDSKKQHVMYLDDIIRYGLKEIFASLPYDQFESYAIKFTRDAELEFDDDFTESFYERLSEGIKARGEGLPVRANFDASFPKTFLNLILRKLDLDGSDSLYPGARYHNRRDLLSFPDFGRSELKYPKHSPLQPPRVRGLHNKGYFFELKKRDLMFHIPYHSFSYLIYLLQEASIDPLVRTIKVTQYRLAKNSCIARALQAAARNGKNVEVLVEPQARFDEAANIKWAAKYRDAGVKVILGVQGLKVHSKLVLIERMESGKLKRYAALGTGNFNEESANVFADHLLMTSHEGLTEDVAKVFGFFQKSYIQPEMKHIHMAPFGVREFLKDKIDREIGFAKKGEKAVLSIKVNNLADAE
ncbi:MAG: phospholipase D-like domain-containing protein, partial [Verrucomicrobiota bacterium]